MTLQLKLNQASKLSKLKQVVGFCASVLVAHAAVAQPIPGADDPALRIAAQRWLDNEDPAEDLWALGEIAADGNVAARMLVNGIFRIPGLPGVSDVDRDTRLTLVPADRDERNRFRSQPYRVDWAEVPALAALSAGRENRINIAKSLWAADLQTRFIFRWMTVVTLDDIVDVEMVQFAESVVPAGSDAQLKLLVMRAMGDVKYGYLEMTDPARAEAFLAGWDNEIWSEDHNAQMIAAVRDNRLAVLMSMSFFESTQHDHFESWNVSDAQLRWDRAAAFGHVSAPALQQADTDAFGAIVIDEAALTPSWRPIVRACRTQCADEVLRCAAVAGYTRANRLMQEVAIGLEPTIAAVAFYDSQKAVRIARYMMIVSQENRLSRGISVPDLHVLPQCLSD
jgi:hypothetical protein